MFLSLQALYIVVCDDVVDTSSLHQIGYHIDLEFANYCLPSSYTAVADLKQMLTLHINDPRHEKTLGFRTRFDTNRVVKPQKMARGSKFRI